MKLTDMHITKKKKKSLGLEVPKSADEAPYPWGLKINLETASLKQLKMSTDDFKLGQRVNIQAIAEVVNISESVSKEYPENNEVGLQIVKIGVSK